MIIEEPMVIHKLGEFEFDVILIKGHNLQKYCATPKGFYQQKKHIIFVGNRISNSTIRIKVPIKDIIEIKISHSYGDARQKEA